MKAIASPLIVRSAVQGSPNTFGARFTLGVLLLAGTFGSLEVQAADPPAQRQQRTIPGLNMVLVKLSKGSVVMGNPASSPNSEPDESPPTKVNFTNDFWLGATEVTVAQWRHFADTTGHISDAEISGSGLYLINKKAGEKQLGLNWRSPGYSQEENHPVVGISWNDAQDFLRWLTEREGAAGRLPAGYVYTLPTEAQWEYACRAGRAEDPADLRDYAWYKDTSGGMTHPVGTKKPNAWGLYDMQGNVWEWVHDWYGRYPGGEVTDYTGPASPNDRNVIRPHHEVRGGGKGDPAGHGINSTNRWSTTGNTQNDWVGFRVALGIIPAPPPPAARRTSAAKKK
jgi:formylglycine-generating enzyme required for sulfatase activity